MPADTPTQVLAAVQVADAQVSAQQADGPTPGRAAAEFVVAAGHRSGTRFELGGDRVTVGRHPDSDVFLDDITVSRRHVLLEASPSGYVLRDVGSLNGTYVNGERIDGDVALQSGDELQVGKFKLLYVVPSDAP